MRSSSGLLLSVLGLGLAASLSLAIARYRPPEPLPDEQALLWELSVGAPPEDWLLRGPLPAQAGSLDPAVERWVRLYLGRGRPLLQRALARLQEARPVLEQALAEAGLPPFFLAVPVAESGLLCCVRSRTGALGPWQLAPETARALYVDDPTDLAAASRAGARYLAHWRHRLQDDDLALAAYNAGPLAVWRALSEAGRGPGPGGWPAIAERLSEEAREYVPKVHAVALILEDPARFGLDP